MRWLGPKPYDELPRYVAAFDVGIIPYAANSYTPSCFPLKLYEYLAAGKPVVASGLPALAGMEPRRRARAEGVESFVAAIEGRSGSVRRASRAGGWRSPPRTPGRAAPRPCSASSRTAIASR